MEITAAYLIMTEQCNLRCTYCYEQHGTRRMTKEMAIDAIDYLMGQTEQPLHLMFFGGEPTLESKVIVDVIDYLLTNNRRIDLGMTTNCTLLPDELKDAIRRWDGKFGVQLSIDGPQEIQDMHRVTVKGEGSWSMVEPTLDAWLDLEKEVEGLNVTVHGCLNKKTLPRLYETFEYFRVQKGVEKLWYIPVQNEEWNDMDEMSYREQLGLVKNWIIDKCKADGNLDELQNYSPLCSCLEHHPSRGKPCAAGMSFVSIAPDGTLSPCHQLHFNTPESTIGDIWNGVDPFRRQVFLDYDDQDFGCGDCEQTRCYRCIAQNYDMRGSLFAMPPNGYCRLMMVDKYMQDELRDFMTEVEKHGFV